MYMSTSVSLEVDGMVIGKLAKSLSLTEFLVVMLTLSASLVKLPESISLPVPVSAYV